MSEVKTTKELFDEMKAAWTAFEENHLAFESKGNKSAASRARKSLGELKKSVTAYRKQSVTEVKEL